MTEERLPWFPCYPSKLLGALAGMKPTEGYVYWIVCLRIYEVNGACPDTLDALARRTGYNKRIVSDALDKLFRTGKLVRVAAGIMNPFAEHVMTENKAHRERLAQAGREGGLAAQKKRKENQSADPSQAIAPVERGSTKATLTEEDSLFPIEGNNAPEIDSRTKLFREGLAILKRTTGKTDDKARALLGRWLREANDDAVMVMRIIEDAERNATVDPLSWIMKAVKHRTTGGLNGENRNGRDSGSSNLTVLGLAATLRAATQHRR